MKTVIGFILFIGLISCSSVKDKGINNLLGEWTSNWTGNEYIVNFTKVDTMITGVLTHIPFNSKYTTNQVLFKDIKFLNDTTIICKGLFMKEVYTTIVVKEPTIFNWGGDDGHGNKFVDKKIFDHTENIYVDYRMELHNNNTELICRGFSEGLEWSFCRSLSKEEITRKMDSIKKEENTQKRIMDSLQKIRDYFYENGTVKRRDFNPPFIVRYNVIERINTHNYETPNGGMESVYELNILPEEREINVTSIYYKFDGKYDKVMTEVENRIEPINFWTDDNKLSSNFDQFITPEEMGDSLKVFNSLKKHLGIKSGLNFKLEDYR
jgi:hypothetical protein